MREILFRGQRADTKEWVYGSLFHDPDLDQYQIFGFDYPINDGEIEREEVANIVIPESVGQYTGLTDKNGTKIFTNDIVRCWGGEYCQGYWEHDSNITVLDAYSIVEMSESENIEIIKDVHDNPKLLK
jgi:uncharacterized phage protein (TIGR01671 family)